MRCETCRFFHAYELAGDRNTVCVSADRIVNAGECRRHPPQPVENDALARFPLVAAYTWCGHYDAAPRPA